jgi:hypothetical protein
MVDEMGLSSWALVLPGERKRKSSFGAGKDEQLGTSHARGKEDPERVIPLEQDGSNGVVSNSSFSLAISVGKEEKEQPPIRRIRGLTPPEESVEKKRSPSLEQGHVHRRC